MKAFKCDRCGEYFDSKDSFSGAELSGKGLLYKMCPGRSFTSVDLCQPCADLLRTFLAEWWKEK